MDSGAGLKQFLLRALPWPDDNDVGYINLHWKSRGQDGKDFWVGKPFRDVQQFLGMLAFMGLKPHVDLYHCMSRQREKGLTKAGKVRAERYHKNAVCLKAIWLDVDVKPPPKGYATLDGALQAIGKFVRDASLPWPSALIKSGGGVHVYWIFKEPLLPDEWEPYAQGLKSLAIKHGLLCDTQCTVDSARILRTPDTKNYKTDPPTDVVVLGMGADYDRDHPALAQLQTLAPVSSVSSTAPAIALDPIKFPKQAWSAALDKNDSLSAGLGREELPPLAALPIFKGCPFYQDALLTGGKGHAQPEWNLAVLGTVFMEGGREIAHKLGCQHPGYTHDSTEDLYQRKHREHIDRGVGWPSCGAIQSAGCGACGSCPHFGKIKSPLNLALEAKPVVAPTASQVAAQAATVTVTQKAAEVPSGFILDEHGYVYKVIEVQEDKALPPTQEFVKMFHNKIFNMWAQKDPERGDSVNCTVTVDGGMTAQAVVRQRQFHGGKLFDELNIQRIKYVAIPSHKKFQEELWMSWLDKLHAAQEAQEAPPFGWLSKDGGPKSFVFGGVIIKEDGSEVPSGYGDVVEMKKYKPTGDIKVWYDAARMILSDPQPGLHMILAAAFASPLLVFSGQFNTTLSVIGVSGAGKSTASLIGAAVWGHPKTSRANHAASPKGILHKMGTIRHLPLFWDEVTDNLSNVGDLLMVASQGVDGVKLNADRTQKAVGEWQLQSIVCSNHSLFDYVALKHKTTNAHLYRIFEYEVKKMDDGRCPQYEANQMLAALEHNHGMMGLKYATLIASNRERVHEMVKDFANHFEQKMQIDGAERFWSCLAATTMAGATLANQIGVGFDLEKLYKFICEQIVEMRLKVIKADNEGGTFTNTADILSQFMSWNYSNQIWTDRCPDPANGQRPKVQVWRGLGNITRGTRIQWATHDRTLHISKGALNEFLKAREIAPGPVYNGLTRLFGARESPRKTLGAGTAFGAMTPVTCVVLDIPPGHEFEGTLMSYQDNPPGMVTVLPVVTPGSPTGPAGPIAGVAA